jgi:hypothetical protein
MKRWWRDLWRPHKLTLLGRDEYLNFYVGMRLSDGRFVTFVARAGNWIETKHRFLLWREALQTRWRQLRGTP